MRLTTHAESIADRIAEEIIRGRLAPGQKLDAQSLAHRFDVSRTPIREALRQLAATRLVDYIPRRGFSVAEIDARGLDDMFEAASELEALCAKLCALRATVLDRHHIESVHRQAKQAVASEDVESYSKLNESLHAAIYAGARNRTLEVLVQGLRQRLAPFRSRVFFNVSNRMHRSLVEHDAIVAAILGQDAAAAAEAMRNHAAHSAMNVMQYVAAASDTRPSRRRSRNGATTT